MDEETPGIQVTEGLLTAAPGYHGRNSVCSCACFSSQRDHKRKPHNTLYRNCREAALMSGDRVPDKDIQL